MSNNTRCTDWAQSMYCQGIAMPKRPPFLDIDLLIKMASFVRIPSKEEASDPDDESDEATTMIRMDPLLSTQVYFLEQLSAGIKQGKNVYYICKCRQSGITTIGHVVLHCLRVVHKGLLSAFIADNSQRLFVNRRLAKKIVSSLTSHPQWSQEVDEDNRYNLSFKNDSVTFWLNANSDDEGGLGRSMGLPVMWGTEMGGWKDEQGTLSLLSSLPEKNPRSLAVFEGTATGPNLFKELYDEAKEGKNTCAIFIPWWRHQWYEHDLSDPVQKQRFDTYWGEQPRLGRDEQRWVEGAWERYGIKIRPTQISWYRWHLREKKKNNTQLMHQEYPSLEEDAWIYGGSMFVDGRKLSTLTTNAVSSRQKDARRYFQFDPGDGVHFLGSDLIEVDPAKSWFDLVCFHEPVVGPRVRYCLGCDPAHGANEESDFACCEVLLCYSDKAVQVAEFLKRDINTTQIAWVILHLVGAYTSLESEVRLNIEMQGGGTEVYGEIKRLQNEMAFGYTPKLARYFQRMTHYIYTQGDKAVAHSNTLHWETSWKSKPRMLHNLRNLIERDMLEIHSEQLIKDCSKISLLRDGSIETPAQNHRVMAMAIAGMAYIQLLDMDIGNDPNYSSKALHEVHAQEFNSLTPDQIMRTAVEDFKARVLREMVEEAHNPNETPDWMSQMRGEVANDYYHSGQEYEDDKW